MFGPFRSVKAFVCSAQKSSSNSNRILSIYVELLATAAVVAVVVVVVVVAVVIVPVVVVADSNR